jgi:hypothetical protein
MPGLKRAISICLAIDDLAIVPNHEHRTGDVALGDRLLDDGIDGAQLYGIGGYSRGSGPALLRRHNCSGFSLFGLNNWSTQRAAKRRAQNNGGQERGVAPSTRAGKKS